MVPRVLGKTGLRVSPIGLGTVKIGRNEAVKYPQGFTLPSDAEVASLLDAALSLGVNFIDTAPAYGESERRLAPFVKKNRDRIVLSTKAGERFAQGKSTYDFTPAAISASLEESLRRLGTDHVDLLFLHSDGNDGQALAACGDVLLGLKSQGKTRAVGISAKTPEGISLAVKTLDVVMAPFSMEEASLALSLQAAHAAGLGVVAIKVLSSGRAIDPEAAIRFVAGRMFVHSQIIGTLNPAHLAAAVRASETPS